MQEHWTSFWEHLDDLRQTFLRSLVVIGVAFCFLLIFYQPIFQFLATYPIEQTREGVIKRKIQRIQITNQTAQDQIFELPYHSRLISNLSSQTEGRNSYQLTPGQTLLYEEAIHSPFLIMGPIEGLVLVFKACFWLSLALTAPIWGWIWLQFILPGLKEQERAALLPFLLISLLSSSIGIAFAYYVTLPIANQYLLLFNSSIGQNAWTLMHYVDYVLLLCLGHVIAAELVLLLLMLVHFHFLSPTWLIEKRRYMIVLAFILGALLTPPDILTQLLLAFPLIGLYEVAIWYAKWINRSNCQIRMCQNKPQ
jgi:sec-independent protein translocase protein TatC